MLALALSAQGKHTFGRDYDRSLNDNLTKGLARYSARNSWRLPLAITRLNRSHRLTRKVFTTHDVVLTPTLSRTTPELGWLNPAQPYETIIDRLLEWVGFTPLQNATGDPAISLPMGQTSTGPADRRTAGRGARLRPPPDRGGLRARADPAVREDPGLTAPAVGSARRGHQQRLGRPGDQPELVVHR